MDYDDKLQGDQLTPDPKVVISGIDELKHMEDNLMRPDQLRG
jgi:hypothetical protein